MGESRPSAATRSVAGVGLFTGLYLALMTIGAARAGNLEFSFDTGWDLVSNLAGVTLAVGLIAGTDGRRTG